MKRAAVIGVFAVVSTLGFAGSADATVVRHLIETRCGVLVNYFTWRSFTVVGQFDYSDILLGAPRDGTILHRNELQYDPQTICQFGNGVEYWISVRYADDDKADSARLMLVINDQKMFEINDAWKDWNAEHQVTIEGSGVGRYCIARYKLPIEEDELVSSSLEQELNCRAFRFPESLIDAR